MAQPVKSELIKGVTIEITPKNVGKHKITVFEVVIIDKRTKPGGSWDHTCGSREKLDEFVCGLRAGAMMIGKTPVSDPEIPRSDW